MYYYKNYRKSRPRYKKLVSPKTNKEKIISLKLEEFESLKNKYQTFTYDKLLQEEKRLIEKININSNFVQEQSSYIRTIIIPSLENKKNLFNTESEKIRSDIKKKYNFKLKYEEPIEAIRELLKKIEEQKKEEYDKSKIIPNLGLKSLLTAVGVAVPFIGLLLLSDMVDKKKEARSYPNLPKTNDEVKIEKKLSIISENKKKTLDFIEAEVKEIIKTTKNLNDLRNEILKMEEEIKTLNNRIDKYNLENPKIREALKIIFPDIKKRTKERERSAKIAAFDNKARTGSQIVKDDLLKSIRNKTRWKCPYCDLNNSINEAVADHIYPVNKGGLSMPENMVLICGDCNKKKSNLVLRVFCKKYSIDFNIVCERLEKQGKYI
jgi:5-methylcytosine-specific restriction endonuclease McrA